MGNLYSILAYPFGLALGWLYEICHNYLIALVVITFVLRLILLPTTISQQKNSAKQMRLQAKVNKIRAKYAGQQGREAQMKISEETQELYRREGFSASQMGCLPLVFQMVVMMGLYGAIYSPLSYVLHLGKDVIAALTASYNLVTGAAEAAKGAATRVELNILGRFSEVVNTLPQVENGSVVTEDIVTKIQSFIDHFNIFGIDLTQVPKDNIKSVMILIPILAGLTAFLSAGFTYLKQRKTNPEMAKNPTMGCMTFMSPVISVVFAFTLPAGIGFYWIISNVLSFIQMVALGAIYKPEDVIAQQMIEETVQRRAREESVKKTKALVEAQRKGQ